MSPNHAQTERFVSLLAGAHGTKIEAFQTFSDRKEGRRPNARKIFGSLSKCLKSLTRANEHGSGCFITVNATDGRGRETGNITYIRAIFLDLDGADLQPVLDCGVEPHLIIESSPGRWHVYWLIEPVRADVELFKRWQHALAARFTGDFKVCDLPRVMRLPGFWHLKGAPFQTRITHESGAAPYDLSDLVKRLGIDTPAPTPKPKPTSAAKSSLPTASTSAPAQSSRRAERSTTIDLIPEGERNHTLFRLACNMHTQKMTFESAEAALLMENQKRCVPRLSEDEVRSAVNSAYRYVLDPDSTSPTANQPIVWTDPQPLPAGLPPVPTFDPALLPDGFRPWVLDIGERMQCPLDYPAVGAMVALGAVVGQRIRIRPKRLDNWQEAPNLWGAIIGPPGAMKSPALSEALKPLKAIEGRELEWAKADAAQHAVDAMVLSAQEKRLLQELKEVCLDHPLSPQPDSSEARADAAEQSEPYATREEDRHE